MPAADRLLARHHADWLALVEVAGPFLSMPVLMEHFPNGLDQKDNESEMRRRLRLAYDEWLDNQAGSRPDPAIHYQWLRFVLAEVLDMLPDVILEGQTLPPHLHYMEHGEIVRPLLAIRSPFEQQPRLLIQLYPHTQNLAKPIPEKKASPQTRMMEMLRHTGIRLGLVTNGRTWMLVDAPAGETTGYYSWDAELWLDEPLTLRAFHSLLGMQRFFNVPEAERLETLLSESMQRQQEVTERLGEQVRRAVNTLVRTLDRLDRESQRVLLHSVSPAELYEAALTVMMRLVFLLSAEERELLPVKESLYEENYAVSTLHEQLRKQADQQSEEVMGLRADAWSRLLAVFRIVYGGVEHENLRLPAYGGRLFDPDRFPFLEGRQPGTSWHATPARPLLIDNRTVLHLLNALQYLQVPVPGGGIEPRRLSFRGLDIEQIGHVYEGLLDHTAKRATTTILGLVGREKDEPETSLDELEKEAHRGDAVLLSWLSERTGRSVAALQKQLAQSLERQEERSRLMEACDNRQDLFQRVLPFAGLLRRDTFGDFIVITPDAFYVTQGSDRRSTGTHYTPRSLTEPIVQHALDPLVYTGPAEGLPQEQWQLRPAEDILNLKVCDMAMGSGAFLVQSCRYLSEKLVAAWDALDQSDQRENTGNEGKEGKESKQDEQRTQKLARVTRTAPSGKPSRGLPDEELLPLDAEERLALAWRIVSERCLYGVDKNPMAVEMAKLSLWLITLAKNRPFTFLDHALRSGDSLLGVNERQLLNWSLDAKAGEVTEVAWGLPDVMRRSLETAFKLRRQIAALPDRDVRDIEVKERLLDEANRAMEIVKLGADLLIAIALSDSKRRANLQSTLGLDYSVLVKACEEAYNAPVTEQGRAPIQSAYTKLRAEVDELLRNRQPFHWPLEFPEVFTNVTGKAGFDAIMSNPPFQGGKKITGAIGTDYRDYMLEHIAHGKRGNADLCAYFFLRSTSLIRQEGMAAMLATNTIAQGDTREVGLDQIIADGWTIPRAIPSRKWPGEANLEVAHVWLRHGDWQGPYMLNDIIVEDISPYLSTPGQAHGNPFRLVANAGKSFMGSNVLGMGFILEPKDAHTLIEKDARNNNVLFPYLSGEDLNTLPDQSSSRWIINFQDWPLQKAETYVDCMQIIREKVKPERDNLGLKSNASAKGYAKLWWQYARKGLDLYSKIANMKRVLAVAYTSRTCAFSFVPTNIVFSIAVIILAFDDTSHFSILQSSFHREWVFFHGSTMKSDLRYNPPDCFETFPFPENIGDLDDIGESYYQHRQSIMLARQEGLTKTYNRFHDPMEAAEDIVRLRELHREMDEAVAVAYGWDDLRLEHGFHETKQGLRYTISEAARREVLDRLLLLNHQRHAEEVAEGLFEQKGGKKTGKGAKGTKAGQTGETGARETSAKMREGKEGMVTGNRGNAGGQNGYDAVTVEGVEQDSLFS